MAFNFLFYKIIPYCARFGFDHILIVLCLQSESCRLGLLSNEENSIGNRSIE
jgi:hypothetical protein